MKQKIINILCDSNGHGGGADNICEFIESNYIPKEEYEKKIDLLSKGLLVIQKEHLKEVETRKAFIDTYEKLREENERLKNLPITMALFYPLKKKRL